MSETNDDKGDSPTEEEVELPEGLQKLEEKREEDRDRASLEWCEAVRDVGEAYRENPDIEEVAEGLNLDVDKARKAAIVYRLIFEDPPDDVSFGAHAVAVDFFNGGHSIESINLDREETGSTDSKKYLREFVGAVYRVHDVEEEDEIGEIPEEMNVELPDLDFDFDFNDIFSGFNLMKGFSPVLNERLFAQTVIQDRVLSDLMDSMNFSKNLANVDMMVDSLPSIAQQLNVPENSFAEIAETLDHIDATLSPPSYEPPVDAIAEGESADGLETEDGIQEETRRDDFGGVEEENVEDIEPAEAIQYSVKTVTQSLGKPNARNWYVNAPEGTQTTMVRVLLFTSTLYFTSGNIVIATAVAMILGPGLADMIRGRLKAEES